MKLTETGQNLLWLYSGVEPGSRRNLVFLRYMVGHLGYIWPVVERLWAAGWLDVQASPVWISDSWGIPYGSETRERPMDWSASLTPKGAAWVGDRLRGKM